MSGKTLDFIDHINPPGGGKEATGLVTRFSRKATKGTQAFPVELHLLAKLKLLKSLLTLTFMTLIRRKLILN